MASKGTVCPDCGYKLRKWAASCPKCRHRFDEEKPAIGDIAKKHLRRMKRAEGE